MKKFFRLFILLALFHMLFACNKDDITPDDNSNLTVNERMNKFINTQMKDIYFWADKIKETTVRHTSPIGCFWHQTYYIS